MTSTRKIDQQSQDWSSFLHRSASPGLAIEREKYSAGLAGKRVLITGAGGCIGSALAKSIAQLRVRELLLLDASEGALYEIDQALNEIKDAAPHVASLTSICGPAAISGVFKRHRPEIVFHTAAFKHVPLMESNPFAVVANNAIGTHVLAETAANHGCEQMVMVSTDKAVDPLSIMGASKRIAELILLNPRHDSLHRKVVRLGNVLGSSGSVVPLFLRQIEHGGPVTVSHPDVRRYFMTLPDAVEALLSALSSDHLAGLLVPELGDPIRILDLAKYLIGQNKEVPIVFTQLRPGDKMEESLLSQQESYRSEHRGLLRAVHTPTLPVNEFFAAMDDLRAALQYADLPALLRAVQRIVPEYRPGLHLREHLPSAVNV